MITCTKIHVSLPQLLQLVPKICQHHGCSLECRCTTRLLGCSLVISMTCPEGRNFLWRSSAEHVNIVGTSVLANNLLFATAILFSGCAFGKMKRLCDFLGLRCVSATTFYPYQSAYLIPTVEAFWQDHQAKVLASISDQVLVVCGDGRCYSSCSAANFCSYTIMDTNSNVILHTETVTKAEVSSLVIVVSNQCNTTVSIAACL